MVDKLCLQNVFDRDGHGDRILGQDHRSPRDSRQNAGKGPLPADRAQGPDFGRTSFEPLKIRFPGQGGALSVLSPAGETVLREDISTPTAVLYLDGTLAADGQFSLPLAATHTAFVYVFEGSARLAGDAMATHSLAVLGPGDSVEIRAGESGARFILVAGRPIGESVVQYGPFVMNTREEIEQAFADYRDGRLVRARAAMTGH